MEGNWNGSWATAPVSFRKITPQPWTIRTAVLQQFSASVGYLSRANGTMEQNAASHSQSDQLNVDWFNYRRRVSRQIKVGDLTLGGDAPIRIQSMTTADTLDVEKTVDESIRMVDAGSELVRITAPS
ncbi:flavodoxin-dependent (E)-4-hydroxy-3-methylbut-2-enyl-diphosphate synthase, partial [Flavobacteriales bacterium]|nr:flavodoxin-dependent (E)-4-hydroxy-3-methylbut-2-enyl-diphosphate synthase [Flavobacteriales bacterium]